MSLEHAILGFLEIGPKTGYDLMKRFNRSVAGFWRTDQSRIYRVLSRLKEEGYVTQEIVVQADRPNRKPYQITPQGRDELFGWLQDCKGGSPHRNPFLVQLFFAGLLSDDEALRLLEEKRSRILTYLTSLPERYQLSSEYVNTDPERIDFFHWLTLDSAVHMRYALIEWIDGAIARIKHHKYERGRQGAIIRWPPYEDPKKETTDSQP